MKAPMGAPGQCFLARANSPHPSGRLLCVTVQGHFWLSQLGVGTCAVGIMVEARDAAGHLKVHSRDSPSCQNYLVLSVDSAGAEEPWQYRRGY